MRAKSAKILLIEDNPDDSRLIRAALAKADTSFVVRAVEQLSEAEYQLKCFHFQAVLADLTLSDSRGLETVVRIRAAAPRVPIVVLTGLANDDVALASLDQGAQEYLIKDRITPEVLDRTIRYAVQRLRNEDMRRVLDKIRASEKQLQKKTGGWRG
jgi:DNA-binding response OmpR family regulator